MLTRLAKTTIGRPKTVLLSVLILAMFCGALASGIMDRITAGGYEKRGAESHHAQQVLEKALGQGAPNL
ncbi:MAG: hypothetical protein ABIS86_07125, partial [Streptosporangiaceae bacterium]